MSLASLFRRNRHRDAALQLYEAIVERAREPWFFTRLGVPDTFDGRFELTALHGFLVLNRLKADRPRAAELAQELFDAMFADFDRRIGAYEAGLKAGEAAALGEALRRNLYGTVTPEEGDVAGMAAYLRACATTLSAQPITQLLAGGVTFAALPHAAR
jgi:cytochrome b pre-mRNA-processing protein 3